MSSPMPPAAVPSPAAAVKKQSKRVGVLGIVFAAVFAALGVILMIFGGLAQAFLYAGVAVVVVAALMVFIGTISLSIASSFPAIEHLKGRNDAALLLVLLVALVGFLLVAFVGGGLPGSIGIAFLMVFMTVPSLQFYFYNRKMIRLAASVSGAGTAVPQQ